MADATLNHRISHHAARVFQYAAFPIVWAMSKIFMPVTVRGDERLNRVSGPVIFIANHIAFYDSFLLRFAMGWRNLPIRFMGVTSFRRPHLRAMKSIGLIHAAYLLFGVFTVVPGRGLEKNIETAKAILSRGGNVLIYPEGHINTTGALMPFKHGAAALSLAVPATVIPIAFHAEKRRTHILVGEPLKKSATGDIESVTAHFKSALESLLAQAKQEK